MTNFFRFFVERHIFASILTISVILLGLAVLPSINRDTFPEADLDEVLIVTRYIGSSPEDIELKITNKIEDVLKSVDGIKRYSSLSIENVSLINLFLDPDLSDPKKVKDRIRERIDAINDFPSDLSDRPTITEIDTSVFPIVEVGLYNDQLPYDDLRTIAKSFKSDLEDIKGVSRVDGNGYLEHEMRIHPIPERLNEYQVSILDILQVISNRNLRASMGTLIETDSSSTIMNDSRLITVDNINSAIVRSNFNNRSIRVSDIANVSFGYETPTILSGISGKSGISFIIRKTESTDILTLTEKIDTLIQEYKNNYPALTFVKANDSSFFLSNRLSVMITNGLIGLILVIIVLSFFLNRQMAFWVSLGIPVAVMGVFFMMPMLGMTINVISLLALIIVIGIIVDDGIIVAENIAKFREAGHSAIDASVFGIQQVFKPVFTTILTTIIAFSPMFFTSGIMGKFIFQIPLVITVALLISLVEVVIALPSHLASNKSIVIQEKPRHKLIQKFRNKYEITLKKCLRYKYSLVLSFVVFFILSIAFAAKFMDIVLFPESSAVRFYVRTEAAPGTPIQKTQQLIKPIEDAINALPKNELSAFTTRIGQTGDGYRFNEQENLGFILVDLVPFSGRKRSARDIMLDIKSKTKDTPGFKTISYQVEAGGPPVGKAINVRIISENDTQRKKAADDVYAFIQSIDGVTSVERDDLSQKNQMEIRFDYAAVSRLNMSISSIQAAIRTAFSGAVASTMRYNNEDVDFRVEFSEADQADIANLSGLLIPNNRGRLIRLNDIATITKKAGSPNYTHFNGKRTITITGDLDKSIITSRTLTNKVIATFKKESYPSVTFDYGGESEETNESVQGLIRSFVLAIIGILFLLILLFNSFWQPFLVILTIPFGLIGVIIAFALHGVDLGFISMVGTVGLTGVVVNDSLVLVNHLNNMVSNSETKESFLNSVVKASGDRIRPILITSFTTVAGLLPLAYGLGGSDPFIAPMALAIGYGLLFSTPLTLFLLPALYLIWNDLSQKITSNKKQSPPSQFTSSI